MTTFLIIWSGQLVSILGSGMTSFALGVWIFERTHQATPFGLTVLFGTLPRILLAPLGGSLADRWNRRWLMILADTGNAVVTLSVVLLLSTGNLQVWQIYLVSMVGSIFSAFQEPAYMASIPMLVPKKDLGRANGLIGMGQAVGSLVSPLLAGLLFVSIGMQGIILIDFVTYFFAVGALFAVRIPQPQVAPGESGDRATVWRDALSGWHYLRERTGLFGLLLYYAMVNFLLNFAAVLMGPLVLSFGTASSLGLVQMVFGIGMLTGSLVMGAWGGPKRRIPTVISLITLSAFGLIITGLRATVLFPAMGLFVMMFCIPIASGSSQAVFQSKIAPSIQGRTFAIRGMISQSMMPLAFLIAGPLADYVFEPLLRVGGKLENTLIGRVLGIGSGRGIGLMFILSGLALIFTSVLVYGNPHIRLVEDELPDAIPDTPAKDEVRTDEATSQTSLPTTG